MTKYNKEIEAELTKLRSNRGLLTNYTLAFGWNTSIITEEDLNMIKTLNAAFDSVKDRLIDRTYNYALNALNEEYDRYRKGED